MLWLTFAVFAADCAPEPLVQDLERAALEGRSEDAARLSAEVESAFACSPAADRALVARFFLAEAVVATLGPDPEAVDEALAAAAAASPGLWNADYGEALHQRYLVAAGQKPALGKLVLDPMPADWTAIVDGAPVPMPADLAGGLHLAQAGPTPTADAPRAPMAFARVIRVIPGETTRVAIAPLAPVNAPDAAPNARKRPLPWLVVGLAGAVGAAATAGGALAQDGAMRDAGTQDDLDAAFNRQKALAYTSYGLMGATAAGFGLYFAL